MTNNFNSIVTSSNDFNFTLFTELTNKFSSKNIIYSSFGLFTILTLLKTASTGKTRDEISNCLNLKDISDSDNNIAFKELFLKTNNSSGSNKTSKTSILQSYNSIWTTTTGMIREEYAKISKEFYFTEIFKIDMKINIKKIKKWIDSRSNNMFSDINWEQLLGDLSELVTINLIYFKDNWFDQFDPKYTVVDEFTLESGEKIQVPMMRRSGAYRYKSFNDFQVVDLTYESKKIMRIILPNEKIGLEQAFMSFKQLISDQSFERPRLESIMLKIPKFSINFKVDFKPILSDLGVQGIFKFNNEELSILEQKHVSIDGINQFSFIQNDEKGTVAGSVTLHFYLGGGYPNPPQVIINRPFIFLIIDTETNLTLYTGVVLNPLTN